MFDHEYTMKKAEAFVQYLFDEVPNKVEALDAVMQDILQRTQICRDKIAAMPEDREVTGVLKGMVNSIQSMLQETDNATLRTFLFSCPKRKDRALEEIQARLATLEWICNRIKTKRAERLLNLLGDL